MSYNGKPPVGLEPTPFKTRRDVCMHFLSERALVWSVCC